MKYYTSEEVRMLIHSRMWLQSQSKTAAEFGVSRSYLSEVMRGKRPPSLKILNKLGLIRAVRYYPQASD